MRLVEWCDDDDAILVGVMARITHLQQGPLEAPIAPIACS